MTYGLVDDDPFWVYSPDWPANDSKTKLPIGDLIKVEHSKGRIGHVDEVKFVVVAGQYKDWFSYGIISSVKLTSALELLAKEAE